MKRLRISRAFIYTIIAALVLQGGFMAYSAVSSRIVGQAPQKEETEKEDMPVKEEKIDTSKIEVCGEIQELIRKSGEAAYESNLDNYKTLLAKLDLHNTFRGKIEALVKEGHKIEDIMIACEFLYEEYGTADFLEKLVKEKEAGKRWENIFRAYMAQNPEFVPKSFEPDYLEELLETPGISKDDIMIADRVSQKVSKPFYEIWERKLSGESWKEVKAGLGILNSLNNLPHVPVTAEQIKKYTEKGLTEDQVVEALVIAGKMNRAAGEIVDQIVKGMSREQIYAGILEARYQIPDIRD